MKKFDGPMLGYLTRPEVRAVLDAPDAVSWAGRRDRAFFSVHYNAGARASEAIGLRVGGVVTETSPTAHLRGKGRKELSAPLWRPIATLLRGWKKQLGGIKDDSFQFPNRSGGKLTRSNVTQHLALALATATAACPQLTGRTIPPHTIRHTTAMHLLQSGVDITVNALWLGHESTTTTTYGIRTRFAQNRMLTVFADHHGS
jgi:integrase/recombinase XerD